MSPLRAPSVDVRTVGALVDGFNSLCAPLLTRALRVGPDQPEQVPGPAAYMKGG